ncbi:uncharacterized protein BJ171DRAFT_424367 [Polychytrium aggregatum]|uniref:uncharacterized protein n=1 Tax=Polychytrium aggregatum TaxID=110093 RepID=UPI0022FED949|nr:uncharacterized protein BJ171DRAFT_424367 [Polychytrium aggregatum]KAI9204219.1 hypothetical protein BJ171DRAFT_424367 [Polychytrium aggregatum]
MSSPVVPTPSIPKGGLFTVQAEARIACPAQTVFAILLDTANYVCWNSFVPEVTIVQSPVSDGSGLVLAVGARLDFLVNMEPSIPSSFWNKMRIAGLEVTCLDSHRVCWRSHFGSSLLQTAERVQLVEDDGAGGCRYLTWETYQGPLAYLVQYVHGDRLQARFQDCANDLKRYAESGSQQ